MSILNILYLIILIFSVINLITTYNQAKQDHQQLEYLETSSPSNDPWRWRSPSQISEISQEEGKNLDIQDTEAASHLFLRQHANFAEFLVHLLGYFFLGIAAFALVSSLLNHQNLEIALPSAAMLMIIATACLQCGDQVSQIDLYPDRIELTTKYALFFNRQTRFKAHKHLKFKGGYQSVLSMNLDQKEPFYKLRIEWRFLGVMTRRRIFFLTCNQTQGSWITGGLEYWNTVVLAAQKE